MTQQIKIPRKEKLMEYDFLIVGAGLFGATVAQRLHAAGKRVLVIDKRPQIGGNVYTEEIEGIQVHRYGAHIFHTNDKTVWEYVNRFAEFNRYTNSPVANYHGKLYSLPFNMYTFNKMWGVVTPEEAAEKIREQREAAGITEPKNLEEQAISLVGTDIYEILVKGYTEKQWGRPCSELPAFIIKRLPVRLTFDNNYFNARYQGIPIGGYTKMVRTCSMESKSGWKRTSSKTVPSGKHWRTESSIRDRWTRTLISALVSSVTGACVSKRRFWILRTIREMRWSTIRTGKLRIPV